MKKKKLESKLSKAKKKLAETTSELNEMKAKLKKSSVGKEGTKPAQKPRAAPPQKRSPVAKKKVVTSTAKP